jgi:hypothetical protein
MVWLEAFSTIGHTPRAELRPLVAWMRRIQNSNASSIRFNYAKRHQ